MQPLTTVRERREASIWTQIHPMFAIGQLGVFLVSTVLFGLYFLHLVPFSALHVSVLVKMAFMIGAIVTGSLWEHDVYGKWWFAPEFLIEDVMTANVLALHIGYLLTVYAGPGSMPAILSVLGVAYAVYALNVGQYIVSHMQTRSSETASDQTSGGLAA